MKTAALFLAFAAAAAGTLAAQETPPPRRGIDLAAIRRAVVTVRALDRSGDVMASGTGFFVGSTSGTAGVVVTAAHVLVGASACSVELSDGQTMRCSVAASDTAKDVLMLQVAGVPPGALRWGVSGIVEDGDEITVVSNPLGQLPGTISKGIVSAQRVMGGTKLIQITAPISHGSSGAPVMNTNGEVIGVVRSTIERGQALNFATATDAIRNMMVSPDALSEAQTLLQPTGLAQGGGGGDRGAAPPPRAGDPGRPAGERIGAPSPPLSGDRDLSVGDARSGRLSTRDSVYRDSTYYQLWRVRPTAGRTVTITLASADFDAYMMVRGSDLDSTLHDDDDGPGCDARIVYRFPSGGPYTILVNTASTPKYATGDFTLTVAEGTQPRMSDDRCAAAGGDAGGNPRNIGDISRMNPIRIGQSISGELTSRDSIYPSDTTYYQLYYFRPRAGSTITIDLSSQDFDPYLIVRGTDLSSSLTDDDHGPGCDARIVRRFEGEGPYVILANTTSQPARQTGRFRLSVTEANTPLGEDDWCGLPTPRFTVRTGDVQEGQLTRSDFLLTDSTYSQRWALPGRAGETVTVDLESDDFDAYVMVRGPGFARAQGDDDSGGGCNARVTVTFPQTGQFEVVVNTVGKRETGRFRLAVSSGQRPSSSRPCNRQ